MAAARATGTGGRLPLSVKALMEARSVSGQANEEHHTMRYCEMCGASEASTECEIVPVLLDDNMETEMCAECITEAKREMTVEILDI